jgi:S1-C subfamily serine protease
VGTNVFHAGRTVTLAEKSKLSERVREHQTSLPFGIRFLEPEEFGLALVAQKDGVKVNALTLDSPFAEYGVEAGDLITSIDDVKAHSLPEFRRQLRRGLIAESVVLRVRRGERDLTRIVFLGDIPLPTAPAPRKAKSAPVRSP